MGKYLATIFWKQYSGKAKRWPMKNKIAKGDLTKEYTRTTQELERIIEQAKSISEDAGKTLESWFGATGSTC